MSEGLEEERGVASFFSAHDVLRIVENMSSLSLGVDSFFGVAAAAAAAAGSLAFTSFSPTVLSLCCCFWFQ